MSGWIPGWLAGTVVGSDYDPMLAKVIAHGGDRPSALRALDRALARTAVLGVTTNVEFLRFLLADPDVVAGRLDTGLLDRRIARLRPAAARRRGADRRGGLQVAARLAGTAPAICGRCRRAGGSGSARRRRSGCAPAERTEHVYLTGTPDAATARVEDGETRSLTALWTVIG